MGYSKFIRGKDLSSKSAQDLSCVLGKRRRGRRGAMVSEEEEEGHREDKVSECDRQTEGHVLLALSWGAWCLVQHVLYCSGGNVCRTYFHAIVGITTT